MAGDAAAHRQEAPTFRITVATNYQHPDVGIKPFRHRQKADSFNGNRNRFECNFRKAFETLELELNAAECEQQERPRK